MFGWWATQSAAGECPRLLRAIYVWAAEDRTAVLAAADQHARPDGGRGFSVLSVLLAHSKAMDETCALEKTSQSTGLGIDGKKIFDIGCFHVIFYFFFLT